MTETDILLYIQSAYQTILQDSLVGIYVHGSLAFGCFHWENSDIDFIVVVSRAPTLAEKEALLKVLLELDAYCLPKGIEMSVVLEDACRRFTYPTPYELHFSNDHKEKCRMDLKQYCLSMQGTDKDLAAHFTVIRQVGITLCGRDIGDVFGEIPPQYYWDSIQNDIRHAVKDIDKNPVYIILNLCRVLAYRRDGLILSKEEGGKWGMRHLPAHYRPLVADAVGSYSGNTLFAVDKDMAHAFAQYMLSVVLTDDNNNR